MKKVMILAVMTVLTVSATAMSYTAARSEALFLSDKMAYELNLSDAQYDAVYEINLDYLLSVNERTDVFGIWWDRRNADLRLVLAPWQYDRFVALTYFYRPISWHVSGWMFHVYTVYTNRSHFYRPRPTVFVSYKGGHNRIHGTHYSHFSKPIHNSHHPHATFHDRGHHQDNSHIGNNHQGNGHVVNNHQDNRHVVNNHQDNGHVVNNHQGNGRIGNGHQGNGHIARNDRGTQQHSRFAHR